MENEELKEPENEGKKKGALSYFVTYLKNLWYDFRTSFKYNNMKLAGILVAIPGIFLGFFLTLHANVVTKMSLTTAHFDEAKEEIVQVSYLKPFDFSALVLFLMVLFGILNIFTSVTMSSKKNLGSVVLATITTSLIVICGALYLYSIFFYLSLLNANKIGTANNFYTKDLYISIASVIVSIVTSIAGVILGFIRYDRTYEKVDR